jgi:four helix bundle protein
MFLKENNLYKKAYDFAIKIVNLYQYLNAAEKKEFILSKQLIRSGTSIGANIAEANGAISKPDFSAGNGSAKQSIRRRPYIGKW